MRYVWEITTRFLTLNKYFLSLFLFVYSSSVISSSLGLLADLNSSFNVKSSFYDPENGVLFEGKIYFSADDFKLGSEPWIYDTQTHSLAIMADLRSGYRGSEPNNFFVFDDKIWFSANDGNVKQELWNYDPATEQAYLVNDISITNSGSPRNFIGIDETLYFIAYRDDVGGEVFSLEKGQSQPELLADIKSGELSSGAKDMVFYDGKLYLAADNGSDLGTELVAIDLESKQIELVADVYAGAKSGNVKQLYVVNDKLFFTATDDNGQELWSYDSATDVAELVADINGSGSSDPQDYIAIEHMLYFSAYSETAGREIWSLNTLDNSINLVADTMPGSDSGDPKHLFVAKDELYFASRDNELSYKLWAHNPQSLMTQIVPLSLEEKDPKGEIEYINNGTELLLIASNGSSAAELFTYKEEVYFSAYNASVGNELHIYDPGSEETALFADVRNGSNSSHIKDFAEHKGVLYFSASDGEHGKELMKFSAALGDVYLAKDIRIGSGSDPQLLYSYQDYLYFTAKTSSYGRELYQYNAYTDELKVIDITAGSDDSEIEQIIGFNGSIYVNARVDAEQIPQEPEDEEGPPPPPPGQSYDDDEFEPEFIIDEYSRVLWKIDPSTATAAMAFDVDQHMPLEPEFMVVLDNTLYFKAEHDLDGEFIYRLDTNNTLVRIDDEFADDTSYNGLYAFQKKLVMGKSIPGYGLELVSLNPADSSFQLIADINVGDEDSYPWQFEELDNKLYFQAYTVEFGEELWSYDGNKVELVADIRKGSFSSSPEDLVVVDDTLVFNARGNSTDSEIWRYIPDMAPKFLDSPQQTFTIEEDATDNNLNLTLHVYKKNADEISWQLSSPSNGVAALEENAVNSKQVYYQPNQDFNGVDTFVVTVSDDMGLNTDLVITVNVTPVNDVPVGSISIVGEAIDGQELSVAINFIDPDGIAEYSVEWLDESGNVLGSKPVYLLTQTDIGLNVRAKLSYVDLGGTHEQLLSELVLVNYIEDADYDGDGLVNSVEESLGLDMFADDSDKDGIADNVDVFPLDTSEYLDTDLDGIGNNADTDDDNDGVFDEIDQAPLDSAVYDVTAPAITAPEYIEVAATDINGTPSTHTDIVSFLSAAYAIDDLDGELSVIHNAPEQFPLGQTTVVFTASDLSGNNAEIEAIVNVVDVTAPVITIEGDHSITLGLGDDFVQPAFMAFDNVDGDLTDLVLVSGEVDTSTLGIYALVLSVLDSAGNESPQQEVLISVIDDVAPVVTGPEDIQIAAVDANGTPVTDIQVLSYLSQATGLDSIDGELDITNNAPEVLPLGNTLVTFTAIDESGNIGTAVSTVTIADMTAPIITFEENTSLTLRLGETFVAPLYTAVDNVDGDVTDKVVISGTVDTNVVGTYSMSYSVTDAAGNTTQDITFSYLVETNDLDNDGVLDELDAFVNNHAASVDTDGDGMPDKFHTTCDYVCQGNSGLFIDIDDDNDGYADEDEELAGTSSTDNSSTPLDNDSDFLSDVLDNDDDNDGVLDIDDAFEFNSSEWSDIDGDGIGDNTDFDIDGDGVLNTDDANPLVAIDEQLDLNRNGIADNIEQESDLLAVATNLSSKSIEVTATGVKTDVEPFVVAALDDVLQDLAIQGVSLNRLLQDNTLDSGEHLVTAELIASSGVTTEAALNVTVNPLLYIQSNRFVQAGKDLELTAALTGRAIEYPVTASYQVSYQDGSSASGDVSIEFAQLSAKINLANVPAGQHLVTLTQVQGKAELDSLRDISTVTALENTAPVVNTVLIQNDQAVTLFEKTGANAYLEIDITDVQSADTHWLELAINGESKVSSAFSSKELIELDLADLGVGNHTVDIEVSETNTEQKLTTNKLLTFTVLDTLVELNDDLDSDGDGISDAAEGYADQDGDGIADYLDNSLLANNQQQLGDAVVAVADGLSITIGQTLQTIDNGLSSDIAIDVAELESALGVELSDEDVAEFISPVLDFEIKGAEIGALVDIVIPLGQPLAANTEYRKLASTGSLVLFDESDGSAIHSTMSVSGQCPNVQSEFSSVWQQGLIEGHDCIKLSILDGGANDEDGQANGVIVDPAVLVRVNQVPIINVESVITVAELLEVSLLAEVEDADNDPITFKWTVDNELISLMDSASAEVSFIAPDVQQDLAFTLTLSVDDGYTQVIEQIAVTVLFVNNSPVIQPLTDHVVNEGQQVNISVDAVDIDKQALTYQWSQTSGSVVQLIDATSDSLRFIAPEVESSENLEFMVTVNDGFNSVVETLNINVVNVNTPPELTVSLDKTVVNEGETITLTLDSTDEDNDELTVELAQTAGNIDLGLLTALPNSTTVITAPEVTADETYTIEVTLSDGKDSIAKSVSFVVKDRVELQVDVQVAGSSFNIWLLLLLAGGVLVRRSQLI